MVEYDLVIIGGGINGAALARLAAFQGLRVGLFEAGDFGQGASTNTSKLLHGGLRYLETFDFGLVRDAVRERAQLLELAPHLVEARRFLFPKTILGRHARLSIKAGMTLYDFFAGSRRLQAHRWIPPSELRAGEPHFLPGETCGAYAYSDCVMDDARLVMENLVDARILGADIRNYQPFQGAENDSAHPGFLEVTVLDRLTQREMVHRCRRLAFALGPWTDQVLKGAFPSAPRQVRLSQGIHLVVETLPSQSCFILPVPGSRRYFFILPWKGKHLIGTTETEVGDYPPDPAVPKEQEVQELLGLARTYFPGQSFEVLCTITGLRPLARAAKGSTITLSREHEFHRLGERVFSAVGGKYTTHRTLAREYLAFILGGKPHLKDIRGRLLPGAWIGSEARENLCARLLSFSFVDDVRAETWMRRYGMRSLELAESLARQPARQAVIGAPYSLLAGEVHFAIENEWAKSPIDFFRRRTDIYFTREAGRDCLEQVEAIFAERIPAGRQALGKDSDYPGFLKHHRHRAA